jgi:hydrogenase small subunit
VPFSHRKSPGNGFEKIVLLILTEINMNPLNLDLSRRDFLKFSAITAAALGLSQSDIVAKVSEAIAASQSQKPPVVWLEGQDCAGCTTSFASSLFPPAASIILDTISLRYHETIMAASGHHAEQALKTTFEQGSYLLLVEGSIPTADDRFCMIGDRPFEDILVEAAKNATAIIAVGACATYGGIPAAGPTKAVGVRHIVKNKPIINISTCPVHVDHLVGTIVYYLTTKQIPPLDKEGRPVMYFGEAIHANCRRRSYFEESILLQDWNDPNQKNWCLIDKGCKGPETYADCSVRRWNNGLNFCIDCGAGCRGCAEPVFYAGMSPLYSDPTGVAQKLKNEAKLRRQKRNELMKEQEGK